MENEDFTEKGKEILKELGISAKDVKWVVDDQRGAKAIKEIIEYFVKNYFPKDKIAKLKSDLLSKNRYKRLAVPSDTKIKPLGDWILLKKSDFDRIFTEVLK